MADEEDGRHGGADSSGFVRGCAGVAPDVALLSAAGVLSEIPHRDRQPLHHLRQGYPAGFHQQVEVIAHQRPSQAARFGFAGKRAEPVQEIVPIEIVLENTVACDSSRHDVMQRAGGVYAGLSGHGEEYSKVPGKGKVRI
ncbi:MAG: hypothetical protein MUC33_21880 [Desulfobacterales bacterium]|nr:hypothetical protein [Desulfobacterales bacterium]